MKIRIMAESQGEQDELAEVIYNTLHISANHFPTTARPLKFDDDPLLASKVLSLIYDHQKIFNARSKYFQGDEP